MNDSEQLIFKSKTELHEELTSVNNRIKAIEAKIENSEYSLTVKLFKELKEEQRYKRMIKRYLEGKHG